MKCSVSAPYPKAVISLASGHLAETNNSYVSLWQQYSTATTTTTSNGNISRYTVFLFVLFLLFTTTMVFVELIFPTGITVLDTMAPASKRDTSTDGLVKRGGEGEPFASICDR